jgi:hypothetical protein
MNEVITPYTEAEIETSASPHLEYLRKEALEGKFRKRLLRDYRLSFQFSFGIEKVQRILHYLVGMQYFQAGPAVQEAADLSLSLITEQEWRRYARPPTKHSPESPEHIAREGKNEWNNFKNTVSPYTIYGVVNEMHEERIDHYGNLTLQLANYMIFNDLKHLFGKGRPKREPTETKYASFLKNYILDGQPTGSPTYNAICNDTREAILTTPPIDIPYLATSWRGHHQREDFYPTDFIADARQIGTHHVFTYRTGWQMPDLTPEAARLHRQPPPHSDYMRQIGKFFLATVGER